MNLSRPIISHTNPLFYQSNNKEKLSLIDFNKTLHIINAQIRKQFNQTRKKKLFNETQRRKNLRKPSHNRTSSLDLLYFQNQSVSNRLRQDFFENFNKRYHQLQNQFKASFPIKRFLRKKVSEKGDKENFKKQNNSKSCVLSSQTQQSPNQTLRILTRKQEPQIIKQKFEKMKKLNKSSRIKSQVFTQSKLDRKINTFKKYAMSHFYDLKQSPSQYLHTIAVKKPLYPRNPRKINNIHQKNVQKNRKNQLIDEKNNLKKK